MSSSARDSRVRTRTLADGTERFDVRYRSDDGMRSTTFENATDADVFRRVPADQGALAAEALLRGVTGGSQTATARGGDMSFGRLADDHFDHLSGVAPRTVETYRRIVDDGLRRFRLTPAALLTRDDVAKWIADRGEEKAGKTVRNELSVLGAVLQ